MELRPALLCLLLMTCSSCSEKMGTSPWRPAPTKINAVLPVSDAFQGSEAFSIAPDGDTRTGLVGDGFLDKVAWSETDKIALWATPDNGATYTLDAEQFTYYTPLTGNALFTATIPQMEDQSYTYYGAYPIPDAVSGTQVTYTLPSTQNGSYDGALDIMLAHPASGSALTEQTPPSAAQLAFAHKCHIMRIQVPTGRNYWGVSAKKLRIKFPTEVVGTLTFDVTNPDAEPVFSNGSNTVMLDLKRPLDESEEDAPDGNYVWLFLRPDVQIEGTLEFTAYSEEGYQSQSLTTYVSKIMEQGRITPVTISIPQELPVSFIDFSIVGNNLGEELQTLHFTAPEGATLRNGSTTQSFAVNSENKYTVGFYTTVDGRPVGELIRTEASVVRYESESALVPEKRVIGAYTPLGHTACSLTVPYLLFEDFSGLTQDISNNEGTTGINDPAAIWFDDYGIPGWSAARVGGKAGASVRISCRREGGMWVFANYEGRMDSTPFKNLKDGVTINVTVNFNYSGSTSGNAPKLKYGFSTKSGAISGAEDSIEAEKGSLTASTNGSYTSVTQAITPFTAPATNATRLAWVVYGDNGGFSGGWFYYIYIDNVKVQIVK